MFHFIKSNIIFLINKFYKITLKIFFVYLILIVILTSLLVFACSIPGERIRNNIRNSLPLFESEGDYPIIGGVDKSYQLDNYTDSYILNIIYNIDNSNPLISSMRATNYSKYLPEVEQNIKVELLKTLVLENKVGNKQYPRYWHGYIVFIRPLLLFSKYSDIRKLYELLFFFLIAIITSLLYKRFSIIVSITFTLSLALVNFIIVPFSLQFSSVFFVAFISMIFFLAIPKFNLERSVIIFFIIGACTSFVDFFTAPLVTFGLPAIILIILRNQNNNKTSLTSEMFFLICIGISWAFGYGFFWISKWALASIILKENIFINGINIVYARLGTEIPVFLNDDKPLFIHALTRNWRYIIAYSKPILWIMLFLFLAIILFSFIFYRVKLNELRISILLFILAILPYVWFIVVSNHTAIHCWFTYRTQSITFMAVFCSIYYAINWQKFFSDVRKVKSMLK